MKVDSLTYIFPLTVCVYLHSIFVVGAATSRKTFLFIKNGRFRLSRASKVTAVGANRKCGVDFLLVRDKQIKAALFQFIEDTHRKL